MDWWIALFVLGTVFGTSYSTESTRAKCPDDYRTRVQTCVMEAEVAPQAGGGLSLITDRHKLEHLCQRGTLHKAIDCLRDILGRCADNATRRHELAMLVDVGAWTQGMALLCDDLHLFSSHFDCMSKFAPRISSCILIRTQMFRQAVLDAGLASHRTLHGITCNFAENIVNCLERPLSRSCPRLVVDTLVTALHRFLPPACAPVPASNEDAGDSNSAGPTVLEAVIVEGGEGTD